MTSRFTSQNETTQQRLSTHTVGLVALSDFRKRRAEVIEQQEREARDAIVTGTPLDTPERSRTGTPDDGSDILNPRKRKKHEKKAIKGRGTKLSFVDYDDNNEMNEKNGGRRGGGGEEEEEEKGGNGSKDGKESGDKKFKFQANSSVSVVPRAVTKAALRREAAERETLRREFLMRQEAVKMTEIAIPFVFYDGTDIPGGVVRVKKGDFIWVFLDKSRKVGADLGVGEKANARREWARVGVDDLMMVRGNIIIPHHYDFLFFIMNKTAGPTGQLLFDYLSEASGSIIPKRPENEQAVKLADTQLAIGSLEGFSDDPIFTKVVDRRWYERNKHIYPASVWQEFDPEKDYQKEVRRDLGGNAFFYS
ncbi:XAP5-domain-containing protein [Daldinia sp. FL1419]|nr:XAP5-domain-containing protein [Daldinia sp. FL1419]